MPLQERNYRNIPVGECCMSCLHMRYDMDGQPECWFDVGPDGDDDAGDIETVSCFGVCDKFQRGNA